MNVTRDTAQIGDTVYQSLGDAVKAANLNAETAIQLIADTTETVTIGSKKIKLRLNGHSITSLPSNGRTLYMGASGVLTVVGPGSITNAKSGFAVDGSGTCHIQGGTYNGKIGTSFKSGSSIESGSFSTEPDAKYVVEGTVTHHVGEWYTIHNKDAAVNSSSGKAATCTSAGYTGGSYCSVDGYVYSASTTIPALGHSYGSWVTTTPATEDAEGVMTGTCSRGDSIITKAIPKLPKVGSDETVTDSSGTKVDVTVTDNKAGKTESGIEYVGSVEYNGVKDSAPAAETKVPETVTVNGSTYVVTKIADKAFEGQEQLTKVTIPETVVEIGDRAFAGTSVENVVLPAATTVIGAGVFQGCDDLKSVDISKAAITEIPADSFNGTSIDSIEIPATVTSIGARAFKGTALTSAELPDAVKAIEKSTFENCAALKSLTTSATVVGYKALAGCTSLRGIDLSKATELGKYALKGDSKLKTVTTGAKLKAIGYKALSGTKVKTLTISSKKLTSASVKGSLKGSSVKKVEVAVSGSKKTVNKYVAKYKKVFKKSNSGKSVDVVAKRIK